MSPLGGSRVSSVGYRRELGRLIEHIAAPVSELIAMDILLFLFERFPGIEDGLTEIQTRTLARKIAQIVDRRLKAA